MWVHGPAMDVVLGFCWLPVALVVHEAEPHLTAVQSIMGVIFLISFAHQPLTLGLVYGDPALRHAHPRLYRWAPWVVFALVVIGLNVSLTLVAVMAGLWNAEHTLMQRYGVMRIYGRKVGDTKVAWRSRCSSRGSLPALPTSVRYVDLQSSSPRSGR